MPILQGYEIALFVVLGIHLISLIHVYNLNVLGVTIEDILTIAIVLQ